MEFEPVQGLQPAVSGAYMIPTGTIRFPPGTETATLPTPPIHVVIDSMAYFVINAPAQTYEELSAIDESYPFRASFLLYLIVVTVTCVSSWIIFLISVLSQRGRPIYQKFTFCFVSIVMTIFFSAAVRTGEQQQSMGYLNARDFVNDYMFNNVSHKVPFFISYTLLMIAEIQVLIKMHPRPLEKKIVIGIGALFVIADVVAWGISFSSGMKRNHALTKTLKVWSGIEMASQAISLVLVVAWSLRCYRYAYAKPNWGLALLSILGSALPIVTILGGFFKWVYVWSIFLSIGARGWTCVVVYDWLSGVERLIRQQRATGDLGTAISARASRKYRKQSPNGGKGTDFGVTTARTRIANFFHSWFVPSVYIKSVTITTEDHPTIELASLHNVSPQPSHIENPEPTIVHRHPLRRTPTSATTISRGPTPTSHAPTPSRGPTPASRRTDSRSSDRATPHAHAHGHYIDPPEGFYEETVRSEGLQDRASPADTAPANGAPVNGTETSAAVATDANPDVAASAAHSGPAGPAAASGPAGPSGEPNVHFEEPSDPPPDFVPHPRFRKGDYWDEKSGRHF